MPEQEKKRLYLIDGHGLAYRMFYALPVQHFTTSNMEPTNATYGFTRTLVNLLNATPPPDYLAVAFDKGMSQRDEYYPDYKATREKMPDDLRSQIERIHEVLEAFSIPILEVEGMEADDILGTIARRVQEMGLGIETTIITGDRDLLQLVDEQTIVQLPARKSSDPPENYDVETVIEKYSLTPEQLVDLKALMGDSSDNIPGVKGIGEKTGISLLQQYDTLDNIYAHLDEITATRARNALEAGKDEAYLSYHLGQIMQDVKVEFDLETCILHDFERDNVVEIFRELEFRSLIDQVPGHVAAPHDGQQLSLFGTGPAPAAASKPESPTNTVVVQVDEALTALAERLENASAIAFDTETTSTDQMQAQLVGISLTIQPGEGYYIPVGHVSGKDAQLSIDRVMDVLRPALTNPDIPKIGHNIKYDAIIMKRHGLEVHPLSFDTMIAQWLLNAGGSRGSLGLKAQAFIRLGIEMVEIKELIGSGKKQRTMDVIPIEDVAPYAAADSDMTFRLWEQLRDEIDEVGIQSLFYDIEMPLVPVLVDMEMAGMRLDSTILEAMSGELRHTLDALMGQILETVGYEFNLNSPQQLSQALFETLNLPTDDIKKTATGYYSTAAGVLESLQDKDSSGVISAILEYREAEKLRSTYVDNLPALAHPETGRIHSSFNQTGTVTGRLSSSNPNLQNIPIRTEMGRRIRDAFVASPGHVLLAADYSQVELRVLAHISGDEALRQAFLEDQDIHATIAAAVYNIPLDDITPAQRSFAKSVNFGLLYGMSAFRLARDSDLSQSEASEFVQAYFDRFPRVKAYLDETRDQASELGYVETLLNRRRYFPALQTENRTRQATIARQAAEREAINMPIQGTAADIIKIAMVNLYAALHQHKLNGRMILQVHDELVLEVPQEEADETLALVVSVMENAYPMDVPLKVDAHIGYNWGEVK